MSSREFVNVILNPFEDMTTRNLLIIGGIGFFIFSVLGYSFHFINDGIINIHFSEPRPYWKYLLYGVINTGSLVILLFAYGKFNYTKTRLVDVLVAVLIAQCVLILVAVFLMNPLITTMLEEVKSQIENGQIEKLSLSPINLGILTLAGILSIFFIYYFFHLLVRGMKIAINSNKLFHTIAIVLLTMVLNIVLNVFYPYS